VSFFVDESSVNMARLMATSVVGYVQRLVLQAWNGTSADLAFVFPCGRRFVTAMYVQSPGTSKRSAAVRDARRTSYRVPNGSCRKVVVVRRNTATEA
jgi:hypothetical protein